MTDHALVRWLERVHGIDMEYFRQRLTEQIAPAAALGARAIKVGGMQFVIDEGRLVTVVPTKRRSNTGKSEQIA